MHTDMSQKWLCPTEAHTSLRICAGPTETQLLTLATRQIFCGYLKIEFDLIMCVRAFVMSCLTNLSFLRSCLLQSKFNFKFLHNLVYKIA